MVLPRSQTNPRSGPTFWVDLQAGRTYTFETRNLSRGSDTVLTLFEGTRGPVAQNDDRVAPAAKIEERHSSRLAFTPRWHGPYAITVTARPGSLEGRCDLYMDAKPLARGLEFGWPYRPPKPTRLPRPRHASSAPPPAEQPFYELITPETAPPPPRDGSR